MDQQDLKIKLNQQNSERYSIRQKCSNVQGSSLCEVLKYQSGIAPVNQPLLFIISDDLSRIGQ